MGNDEAGRIKFMEPKVQGCPGIGGGECIVIPAHLSLKRGRVPYSGLLKIRKLRLRDGLRPTQPSSERWV